MSDTENFNRAEKACYKRLKPECLTLKEALKAMHEGKRVTHKDRNIPLIIKDGKLWKCNYDDGGNLVYWKCDDLTIGDFLRKDWKVVDD